MSAYRVPAGDRPLTIEEFERLPPDEYRDELVRGWVVREPSPGVEHGGIVITLGTILANFIHTRQLGRVVSDSGFILAEAPPTVRAPDIAFIAAARIPPSGLPARYFPGAPDLAVEVVSPSNSPKEIQAKVDDYLSAGTLAVWVVEPRTRTVVVHEAGQSPRTLGAEDDLSCAGVLPEFVVRVGEIFEGG
jgi:Uma2 family endonuclease